MTAKTWTAADMIPLAADWLLSRYPNAKLVTEFVCGRAANARIDLAAITHDGIVGVEIKASGDDGRSLKHQGYAFSAVAQRVWLFTGPGAVARTSQHRPEFWGELRIMDTAQGPLAAALIDAPTSPFESAPALLSLLWADELNKLAKSYSIILSRCRAKTLAMLADRVSLAEIRMDVCTILERRRWRDGVVRRIGAQILPADAPSA